jgi:hypothetical protein
MSYFFVLLNAVLAAGFFGAAAMTSRASQVRLFPRCVDRIPPARILAHIFINTFAASRMDDWSDAAADHATSLFSQHAEHLEPAAGAMGGVVGGAVGHVPGGADWSESGLQGCHSFCQRRSERDPVLSAGSGDGPAIAPVAGATEGRLRLLARSEQSMGSRSPKPLRLFHSLSPLRPALSSWGQCGVK